MGVGMYICEREWGREGRGIDSGGSSKKKKNKNKKRMDERKRNVEKTEKQCTANQTKEQWKDENKKGEERGKKETEI